MAVFDRRFNVPLHGHVSQEFSVEPLETNGPPGALEPLVFRNRPLVRRLAHSPFRSSGCNTGAAFDAHALRRGSMACNGLGRAGQPHRSGAMLHRIADAIRRRRARDDVETVRGSSATANGLAASQAVNEPIAPGATSHASGDGGARSPARGLPWLRRIRSQLVRAPRFFPCRPATTIPPAAAAATRR